MKPTAAPIEEESEPNLTTAEFLLSKKLLFEHHSLSAANGKSNAFTNLKVDVNLEGRDVVKHEGGAVSFKLRYPHQDTMEYDNNEVKKWCFKFAFDVTTPSQTHIDRIAITVAFNYWNVERGFDRMLITHSINATVIEPAIVIAGRGNDDTINTFYPP
eukprot:78350_1